MYISLTTLLGFTVQAKDGQVGSVRDALFDDQFWTIRFLEIDTNKWLPLSEKVLVSPVALEALNTDEEDIHVKLTKQEVKDSPKVEEHEPVSRQMEKNYFDYFGYGYYWIGPGAWGEYPFPMELADAKTNEPDIDLDDLEPKSNHLRSVNEVISYGVEATNGHKGHVKDFILNTKTWTLEYIVVDTRDWLPGGKKVIISPEHLNEISWMSQSIVCDVNMEAIKISPQYVPEKLNDPDYLEQVRKMTKHAE